MAGSITNINRAATKSSSARLSAEMALTYTDYDDYDIDYDIDYDDDTGSSGYISPDHPAVRAANDLAASRRATFNVINGERCD